MWYCTSVKATLCLSLLFASYALADEAADRLSIDRVIAAIDEQPQPPALFTEDASSELGRLPDVKPVAFRLLRPAPDPAAPVPGLTISHEPWGEATIGLPGTAAFEVLNPHITSSTIRLITADVALADATWTYKEAATTQTLPLLFVMKKEGVDWKIASLRVLATH